MRIPEPLTFWADQEQCDRCQGQGSLDGDAIPTPYGPHYPNIPCPLCNGCGWVIIEHELAGMS